MSTDRTSNNDVKKNYYPITEFAEKIGVSPQTLRVWEKTNKFKPHHKTPGGHRFYSHDQLEEFFETYNTESKGSKENHEENT